MGFDDLLTGVVISYPFLWAQQAERGETEGRKPRPTVVALRLGREGGDAVALLPLTTKFPGKHRVAVEVPEAEKPGAGLDTSVQCWIILDEFNTDIVGNSYYLEPDPPLGAFSRAFFLPVARKFIAGIKVAQQVSRQP